MVRWAGAAGGALIGGAGLGFIARDVFGIGQPGVALAWLAGAVVLVAAGFGRRRGGGR
jgi:hypothetical protein